jgi:magnesium transporter
MVMYLLGEKLCETSMDYILTHDCSCVTVVNEAEYPEVLKKLNMSFEGEYRLSDVSFCKMENHMNCLFGTLCIPSLIDVIGFRYNLMIFINANHVVIVDNNNFAIRMIKSIMQRSSNQGDTKERFLYNFVLYFINRGTGLIDDFENTLMSLEDDILHDKEHHFQEKFVPIRKQLLILRTYYEQMVDLCRELEENENKFFQRDQLRYFGILTDRADRLMDKTKQLLDYATQVKEANNDKINKQQNDNMQFLTIITSIFYPLTLITGWYGMNFENMPELKHGYPFVIALSVVVFIICVIVFKKKKIL